ncbi:unnamed protein product, partial [Ectocarpus sp. 4 AP-2014]
MSVSRKHYATLALFNRHYTGTPAVIHIPSTGVMSSVVGIYIFRPPKGVSADSCACWACLTTTVTMMLSHGEHHVSSWHSLRGVGNSRPQRPALRNGYQLDDKSVHAQPGSVMCLPVVVAQAQTQEQA